QRKAAAENALLPEMGRISGGKLLSGHESLRSTAEPTGWVHQCNFGDSARNLSSLRARAPAKGGNWAEFRSPPDLCRGQLPAAVDQVAHRQLQEGRTRRAGSTSRHRSRGLQRLARASNPFGQGSDIAEHGLNEPRPGAAVGPQVGREALDEG